MDSSPFACCGNCRTLSPHHHLLPPPEDRPPRRSSPFGGVACTTPKTPVSRVSHQPRPRDARWGNQSEAAPSNVSPQKLEQYWGRRGSLEREPLEDRSVRLARVRRRRRV